MVLASNAASSYRATMRFSSENSVIGLLCHYKDIRYRNVNPEDAYVIFINFYNRALEFSTFHEFESDDKSILGDTAHSHPAKCMDYGSLIRTLEWAYWKQQRNLEKRRRRSVGNTWFTKKDKEKGTESDEKMKETKKAAK